MFPTSVFSSRYAAKDPKYLQLSLLRQALDAGSVPSHHSVPPPHNDGSHWIEFLQSSPIPQMLSSTPSSVPSHKFIPPYTSLRGDRTPELFYGTPDWSVSIPERIISGRRPPRRSPPKTPEHVFSSPGHTGFAVIESLQASPIPQILPLMRDSNLTKSTRSNVTCPSRSKPWHSSRRHLLGYSHRNRSSPLPHPLDDQYDVLEEPFLSALSPHTSQYSGVESVWPEGQTAWPCQPRPPRSLSFSLEDPVLGSSPTQYLSSQLLPRQSSPVGSSHRFHSQHEKDYFLAKSISSSLSGGTPVSTISNHTSHYTEVDSVGPDGPTEWLSEPLPPRSRPYLLDNDFVASPDPQCSSLQDPGTQIILPAAADLVPPATAPITSCLIGSVCSSTFRRQHLKTLISSPRNYSPVSRLFFLPALPSVRLSFCASLSVFLLLFGFILTSGSFNFSTDSRYAAHELHPGWQIWHLMVP